MVAYATMMVTTKEAEPLVGVDQRAIQKRIKRLGLKVKRVGGVLLLSSSQVQKIKNYIPVKPGPKKSR